MWQQSTRSMGHEGIPEVESGILQPIFRVFTKIMAVECSSTTVLFPLSPLSHLIIGVEGKGEDEGEMGYDVVSRSGVVA